MCLCVCVHVLRRIMFQAAVAEVDQKVILLEKEVTPQNKCAKSNQTKAKHNTTAGWNVCSACSLFIVH